MVKEDMTYFKVYSVLSLIKEIKKINKKHFVYEFIKNLKVL